MRLRGLLKRKGTERILNTKTILPIVTATILITSILLVGNAFAASTFKVVTKIVGASSEDGKAKITVTVEDGGKKTKKINLGKEALYWDDSEFFFTFKFKGVEIGDTFKACIKGDGFKDCESGVNNPGKQPEQVTLSVG
jgi:hypothetical protein